MDCLSSSGPSLSFNSPPSRGSLSNSYGGWLREQTPQASSVEGISPFIQQQLQDDPSDSTKMERGNMTERGLRHGDFYPGLVFSSSSSASIITEEDPSSTAAGGRRKQRQEQSVYYMDSIGAPHLVHELTVGSSDTTNSDATTSSSSSEDRIEHRTIEAEVYVDPDAHRSASSSETAQQLFVASRKWCIPAPRKDFTLVQIKSKLYLFGGELTSSHNPSLGFPASQYQSEYTNSSRKEAQQQQPLIEFYSDGCFFEFDLSTRSWTCLDEEQDNNAACRPFNRSKHIAVAYKNRYLIVYGGTMERQQNKPDSVGGRVTRPLQTGAKTLAELRSEVQCGQYDVFIYDTLERRWMTPSSGFPIAFSQSAALYQDRFLCLFGGVHLRLDSPVQVVAQQPVQPQIGSLDYSDPAEFSKRSTGSKPPTSTQKTITPSGTVIEPPAEGMRLEEAETNRDSTTAAAVAPSAPLSLTDIRDFDPSVQQSQLLGKTAPSSTTTATTITTYPTGEISNSLHILDLDSMQWSHDVSILGDDPTPQNSPDRRRLPQPDVKDTFGRDIQTTRPTPRFGQRMVATLHGLYIVGGFRFDQFNRSVPCYDSWQWDIRGRIWSSVEFCLPRWEGSTVPLILTRKRQLLSPTEQGNTPSKPSSPRSGSLTVKKTPSSSVSRPQQKGGGETGSNNTPKEESAGRMEILASVDLCTFFSLPMYSLHRLAQNANQKVETFNKSPAASILPPPLWDLAGLDELIVGDSYTGSPAAAAQLKQKHEFYVGSVDDSSRGGKMMMSPPSLKSKKAKSSLSSGRGIEGWQKLPFLATKVRSPTRVRRSASPSDGRAHNHATNPQSGHAVTGSTPTGRHVYTQDDDETTINRSAMVPASSPAVLHSLLQTSSPTPTHGHERAPSQSSTIFTSPGAPIAAAREENQQQQRRDESLSQSGAVEVLPDKLGRDVRSMMMDYIGTGGTPSRGGAPETFSLEGSGGRRSRSRLSMEDFMQQPTNHRDNSSTPAAERTSHPPGIGSASRGRRAPSSSSVAQSGVVKAVPSSPPSSIARGESPFPQQTVKAEVGSRLFPSSASSYRAASIDSLDADTAISLLPSFRRK